MANDNPEREFRLRPHRPRRTASNEPRAWSIAFKRIIHIVRMSSKRRTNGGSRRAVSRPFMQRCAIRVTYSANRTKGQWAAHGRYIARESAIHSDSGIIRAFGPGGAVPDIHTPLSAWQKAGDPRLFKLIISPEFGERVDLERLTRQLVANMEEDFGTRLEWVAAIHSNTEHPHVHVAMRGISGDGKPLFLPRRYVQHGIRQHAEELVTAQLGRRSNADIQESRRRETHQLRYTSLDQIINRIHETRANGSLTSVPFLFDLSKLKSSIEPHYLKARLLFLEKMGLAEPRGSNQWYVHSDLQTVLKAMGQARDRQRTLAAHRTVLSDIRLPVRVTDPATLQQSLEGRIIAHGEEEMTGRTYMIVEGTDHQIHFIYHTREFDGARHRGRLKPNTFVRVTHESAQSHRMPRPVEFGDAEMFLKNKSYFRLRAEELKREGRIPADNRWAGWIGRYDTALSLAFREITDRSERRMNTEQRQRGR